MNTKVTFLDDNEDLRIMIARMLKAKLDIECVAVSSLQELIESSEEVLNSDLVILDMNLGTDGSGLDAYRWLQENGYKGKIFFLTGYDEKNPLVEKAFLKGAEVYQKPMAVNRLLSIVNSALYPRGM